jgi:hypothetical protein
MATKVKLIETGAVTGNIIPDGGIATGKLANDAVTTIKISDANITHAKLHTSMDLTGKTVTVATAAGSTNTTAAASTAFVQQELTTLIGGAPGTLDTLNELAAAINNDSNYNSTLTTALATKLPLAGGTMTGALTSNSLIKTTGDLEIASTQPRIMLDRGNGSYTWNIYNGGGSGNFPLSTFNIANNAGTSVLTALDNGNVGIGTTSPNAPLSFGVTSVNSQVALIRDNGNSRTGFGITSNYGVRVFGPIDASATGNVFEVGQMLGTNGTTYQNTRFAVQYDGNVGIGTTNFVTTGAKLQVKGTSATPATSGSNFTGSIFSVEGTSTVNISMGTTGASSYYGWIQAHDAGTGTNYKLNLNPLGGNVGIGTTSPGAKLTITDENAGQPMLQVRNFNTSATGSFGNNHSVELRSASSTTTHGVLIHHHENNPGRRSLEVADSSGVFATFVQGKVGIGTPSPNSRLMVIDTGDSRKQIEFGNHVTYRGSIGHDASSGRNEYRTEAGGGMHAFFKGATSTTPEMIIDNNGNVGIGTPSPIAILHLEGNTNSYSTAPLLYFGSTSTANANIRDWAIGPADSNYGDFHIFQGTSTGADARGSTQVRFTIDANGNVGIGDRTPHSKLTVSHTGAGDGSNIADFVGSDTNQRLIISNFTCGSDEDRVGFIWENQGVALWRQWMDDAGNLRLKTSNPTSNTDGKRIVTTESNIGRTIIESLSIGNVASASADFQGGHGVASAGIQKFNFTIQGDNTWRTVLTNVHDCSFEMTAVVGDAQSRDNAAYSGTVASPAYGVSSFTNIYYHNGGWNTGAFEFRILAAGIDYDIQCRFSSYYSTTNVGSGYLMFKRLY